MGHAARCPGHPPGFQQWVNASDLSFGLFQDSEPPENRDFLVYLGLLGLRGSPGTAQKQPESTKLGPRKSESLVRSSARSSCPRNLSSVYCFCACSSLLTSAAAVKNRTRSPRRQAARPNAVARCVLTQPSRCSFGNETCNTLPLLSCFI